MRYTLRIKNVTPFIIVLVFVLFLQLPIIVDRFRDKDICINDIIVTIPRNHSCTYVKTNDNYVENLILQFNGIEYKFDFSMKSIVVNNETKIPIVPGSRYVINQNGDISTTRPVQRDERNTSE